MHFKNSGMVVVLARRMFQALRGWPDNSPGVQTTARSGNGRLTCTLLHSVGILDKLISCIGEIRVHAGVHIQQVRAEALRGYLQAGRASG